MSRVVELMEEDLLLGRRQDDLLAALDRAGARGREVVHDRVIPSGVGLLDVRGLFVDLQLGAVFVEGGAVDVIHLLGHDLIEQTLIIGAEAATCAARDDTLARDAGVLPAPRLLKRAGSLGSILPHRSLPFAPGRAVIARAVWRPEGLALPHTMLPCTRASVWPARITQQLLVRPCSPERYQNPSGRTCSTLKTASALPNRGSVACPYLLRTSVPPRAGIRGTSQMCLNRNPRLLLSARAAACRLCCWLASLGDARMIYDIHEAKVSLSVENKGRSLRQW